MKLDVKRWMWLAYPVMVLVLIGVSLQVMLGGELQVMQRFIDRQKQVETEQEMAARLRGKLSKLETANLGVEAANLQFLVDALPTAKQVWVVVSELKVAAGEAGVVLESYKGKDDLSVEGNFVVGGADQLRQILENLEKRLPLVKVLAVKYAAGKATVDVVGAWGQLASVSADLKRPVPETGKEVSDLRQQLQGFVKLPGGGQTQDTGGTNQNPF